MTVDVFRVDEIDKKEIPKRKGWKSEAIRERARERLFTFNHAIVKMDKTRRLLRLTYHQVRNAFKTGGFKTVRNDHEQWIIRRDEDR